MSGVFGNLLGQLGGMLGGSSNAQAGAGGLLSTVINAACGGPAGILAKFQQSGLGAQAESWVGNGHNLPVSP